MTGQSHHYSHGYDKTTLAAHSWRSIDNSAAFLLPHLSPNTTLLDVGCGPGSVTNGFATRCGSVVGVDIANVTLEQARQQAKDLNLTNVEYKQGDVFALPFEDGTFDVTFCHQMLHHLTKPVDAIKEMTRVTKRGGLIAVRETDFGTFVHYPERQGILDWNVLMHKIFASNGTQADAGRRLPLWFGQAGFAKDQVKLSCSSWVFRTAAEKQQWGLSWADRIVNSELAKTAQAKGFATQAELERISQAWRDWVEDEEGVGFHTSMEINATK